VSEIWQFVLRITLNSCDTLRIQHLELLGLKLAVYTEWHKSNLTLNV